MAVTSEPLGFADAAQSLATIPFFVRLSAVDLARLVPELEERSYAPGETVFRQGDPGDGLYLIRAGTASVLVESAGNQRTVAVLESPASFGEMALLSDAPRSATIVALRPLLTWRLSRERFDALIDRHPRLLRQVAAELTNRLADTTRRLSSSEEEVAAVAEVAFRSLDATAQRLLCLAALFNDVSPDCLCELLGQEWPAETFSWLAEQAGFFQAVEEQAGCWQLPSPRLRAFLLEQLRATEGTESVDALRARAGDIEARRLARRHRSQRDADVFDGQNGLVALDVSLPSAGLDDPGSRTRVTSGSGATTALPHSPARPRVPGRRGARGARSRAERSADGAGVRYSPAMLRRAIGLCVMLAGAVLWFADPLAGLSVGGHRVLVTVVAALAIGLLDVVPDYLLGLLMVALWAATGMVPASVTASGLATSTWVLLLASLAIGVAVARSGLLFRMALDLTRRLPPNHALRCAGLATLEFLATAAMPSAFSRLALASPIAQDIADSLREIPGSRRVAGLGLATFIGFGQLGTAFLTGSSATLVVYGLLPPSVQGAIGWGTWVVAALPAHAILLGLSLLFIAARYGGGASQASAETLQLQRHVLGQPSRDEIAVAVALIALLAGFLTQPLHGVNAAWLAVAIVLVLAAIGVLDDATVRSGVNWGLLLYLGIVLGFGQVFAHVGLDTWLAQHMSSFAGAIGGNVWIFLAVVLGVGTLAGLVLRAGPGSAVLCLVVFPIAPLVGVNEWVVGLVVLMSTNLWVYPQQSVYYLLAYEASNGRGFTHRQARPLAFAYAASVWIAVLASVPYWRWLGLIH